MSDPEAQARDALVRDTIERRGVQDPEVLRALRAVPRHRFVPDDLQHEAYRDWPLPIGQGQTISQPYVVALMAELARVGPGSRVLDVGTGSGYQAAVLAEIGADVWSIERLPELCARAGERLAELGYRVRLRTGDGKLGWPEEAPFDAILVAAAAVEVPPALLEQLAPGGRLVIPVGDADRQELLLLERTEWGGVRRRSVTEVLFVPLV